MLLETDYKWSTCGSDRIANQQRPPAVSYGRGRGVGRGLAGGLDLGVGVGRGVAVGVVLAVAVGLGVGVGVGVAPPAGAWIATVIGDPVLKNPTVAFPACGG